MTERPGAAADPDGPSSSASSASDEHEVVHAVVHAVVMGLGSFGGGLGAARFLARRGAHVTVTDLRSADELAAPLAQLKALVEKEGLRIRTVLGPHAAGDFDGANLIVANPAVRPDHPLLVRARAHGTRVTTEVELFLEQVLDDDRIQSGALPRVICVTGTQGKSSTCHILHGLLTACGRRAHLGGNIGGSLLDQLDEIESGDIVVLELSSYQLEAIEPSARIRRVAGVILTNVLADHLERHGNFENYAAAKRRILALLGPDGIALLPASPSEADGWTPPQGHYLRAGSPDFRVVDEAFLLEGEVLAQARDLALEGSFQRENALLALGMARRLGVPADALGAALGGIRGLEHRFECLGTADGRRVFDNAVSTTPDSTIAAVRSLPHGVHLILGGRKKALPIDELVAVAARRVARAVCFGEARDEFATALERAGVNVARVERVEAAVSDAMAHAPRGADVLFSPACASFDAYSNFRARAVAFRSALPPLKSVTPEAPIAPLPPGSSQ